MGIKKYKKFFKKAALSLLIFSLSFSFLLSPDLASAAVSPMIGDFLCEKGISYYNQGQFDKALLEFQKALLANPELIVARDFINKIKGTPTTAEKVPQTSLATERQSVVETFIEGFQQKTVIKKDGSVLSSGISADKIKELSTTIVSKRKEKSQTLKYGAPGASQKAVPVPEEILIDVNRKEGGVDTSNIAANVGQLLVLQSNNIVRFLVTNPKILKVTQLNSSKVLLEPLDVGTSFLHLWDDQGIRTFKVNVDPRQLDVNLVELAKERFIAENLPESFKFSYSIEDSTFMTGRGFGDLERKTHTMSYSSSIVGETPFGNFDFAVRGNRTNQGTYNVSSLRMGLTRAHYDQFKDINLRFFDFTPGFLQFGFPTSDLRGVMVDALAFNKRLSYTAFQGALPQGEFTQLSTSSGLVKTKDAYLEGIGLNYKMGRYTNLKTFYAHSYGSELINPVLTNDATGFGIDYGTGRFSIGSAMTYDMLRNISYTANSSFSLSKLNVGLSMTDTNKNFASILGGVPNSGYTSGNLNLTYQAAENVTISSSFSGNRDKVFGNPDRPTRPNYNSNTRVRWIMDSQTNLEFAYTMDDLMGSVSPSVTETKEGTFRKKIYVLKPINTFINYSNRKSKNYKAPSQDFNDNRILAGLNFRVLSEMYFYYNREFNFLYNKFTEEHALPYATEYGLNYYKQIWTSPFYLNWRIYYRDEESTESVLSYLSGEDRVEGEAELTYKPNPDSEIYLKCRIANIWAEKVNVTKHFDLDFNWGLRFVWDTGLRWEPIGSFSGFVFYDANGDGVKQPQEKGIKGVVIKSSDSKKTTTDDRGSYKFSGLKGRKATFEIDLSTIPKGYNPTSSVRRTFDIVHWKTKRVDFGLMTRSEVSGIVFVDKNNNGQYDVSEETVKGVVLILDDKMKIASSLLGEYIFRKLNPGEHVLKLDLTSIPVKYIPKIALQNKIQVSEGAMFVFNVPLVEQKKENPKK